MFFLKFSLAVPMYIVYIKCMVSYETAEQREEKKMQNPINDPNHAGALASRKIFFGENSRYAVAAVHTRFDSVSWFVWDAEEIDPVTDGPAVIRQADTFREAMDGFSGPTTC